MSGLLCEGREVNLFVESMGLFVESMGLFLSKIIQSCHFFGYESVLRWGTIKNVCDVRIFIIKLYHI